MYKISNLGHTTVIGKDFYLSTVKPRHTLIRRMESEFERRGGRGFLRRWIKNLFDKHIFLMASAKRFVFRFVIGAQFEVTSCQELCKPAFFAASFISKSERLCSDSKTTPFGNSGFSTSKSKVKHTFGVSIPALTNASWYWFLHTSNFPFWKIEFSQF